MKKWEQLQLTLDNLKSENGRDDYLDNTQIWSRQREFQFLNVNFYRFFSEVTSEIVWFLECLQQEGLFGVQFFEYLSYRESIEFTNFQIFLVKFK